MGSFLDDPGIRPELELLKNIILRNGNQYPWIQLRDDHGFDVRILEEVTSKMLEKGELFEPRDGILSVAWSGKDDDEGDLGFSPLLTVGSPVSVGVGV